MAVKANLAPPSSVVLISDTSGGEIPKSMNDSLISATNSCVAVGCLSEDDGVTEFTLGTLSEFDRKDKPAFEGILKTPNYKVAIRSVLGQQLLELPVRQELTRLKIWVNDASEPNNVIVAVD